MKMFLIAAILLTSALAVGAQEAQPDGVLISPVISQGHFKVGKKGHGEFTVTNNKNIPISVVIASGQLVPQGTDLAFQKATTFTLKLDSTSAKIGPHQNFIFGYTATGISSNTLLLFNVKVSGPHINEGTVLAFSVPVLDYVCTDTEKKCRERMLASWGMTHESVKH